MGMAVKVKDILNFGGLLGSTVIAGEGGLDTNVESVSVLEIADSSISRWVEANQLYITSFYAIWDDVEQQKIVIKNLKDNGCCGLVLCNIGLLMQKVDLEVISYCNDRNFPLIRARANVSYIDIMSPIMSVLFNDSDSSMQRAAYSMQESLQNDFLSMILNGESQEKILREMNRSMGTEISYYDTFGKLLYSDKKTDETESEAEYLRINYNHVLYCCRERGYTVLDIDNKKRLVVQIRTHQNMFGLIITDYDPQLGNEFITNLMSNLIMPCALLFGREDRIIDYNKRLRKEFITDLITGNFTTDVADLRRASDLKLDIRKVDRMMILNVNTVHRVGDDNMSRDIQAYIEKSLVSQINGILLNECPGSWSEFRSDVVVLFMDTKACMVGIEALAERFMSLFLSSKLDLSLSIGISNVIDDFHDIPAAYGQAYNAAILGREHYGTEKIIFSDQIWFFSQLQKMGSVEENTEICRKLLEPLTGYDEKHGTELVKTISVLMHNNCNVKAAADNLYVHKNTMLQRKHKITELLGYSPYEMPHLLNFLMAFEILGY